MLIMSLTPPITAFIGWLIMDEVLTTKNIIGMVLTITGIVLVVIERRSNHLGESPKKKKRLNFSYPIAGLLLAFGGAVGQGTGLVLSKFGMQDMDPFAATQIRVITGFIGFSILFIVLKRWKKVFEAIKNKKAMRRIGVGAFFGPFLGVSFSLLAVKHTTTGVASTIMGIVPVLIIPPAVLFFKEKVTPKEIVGSVLAVGGVALFFL
jgi:drug/metabolite transporter (DMT)-like permease